MRLQLGPPGLALCLGALAVALASPAAGSGPPRESPFTEQVAAEYGQYADTDHVFVETPSITGKVSDPTAGWSAGGHYLVDVVSAASVDIVSTASRAWHEVRQEGSVEAAYEPKSFGVQANAGVSDEPDYLSLSAGAAVTQDLDNKNVTWLLGYAFGHDVSGRAGTPFSVFSHVIERHALDGVVTVVLGPHSVGSLIGDAVFESGDSSKPYRYIPLFAPGTSVPRGASVDLVNALRVSARPLEQLPLSRQRYGLTARAIHRFSHATLRLDERLYADSWGMMATTTDARYLVDVSPRVETGPHVRVHAQSSVEFWQRAYTFGPGFDVPALRTGDRELGPLVNLTGGWTLRIGMGPAEDPTAWVLGFNVNATSTEYLDDLYVTRRFSALGGLTLEANL
ncbi:MAG TPA: DUF3570 domain-containing protein [Polyangiaceae bacterium]|nr:DUF3570 domain-containing protein [Polyangiaceae bacterium]